MKKLIFLFVMITRVCFGQYPLYREIHPILTYPQDTVYLKVEPKFEAHAEIVCLTDEYVTHTIQLCDTIDDILVVFGCSSVSVYAIKNGNIIADYPDWPIAKGVYKNGVVFDTLYQGRLDYLRSFNQLFYSYDPTTIEKAAKIIDDYAKLRKATYRLYQAVDTIGQLNMQIHKKFRK